MGDDGTGAPQLLTVPPEIEVRLRVIGAGLIIAALIIALVALKFVLDAVSAEKAFTNIAGQRYDAETRAIVQAHLQNISTVGAGLFGALTTFLGTAIGAYFGIAAAQSSNKAASTAVLQHAQMASQLASQTQSDNAQLRQQLVTIATRGQDGTGEGGRSQGAGEDTSSGSGGPPLDPKDEPGAGHASPVAAPSQNAGLAQDLAP